MTERPKDTPRPDPAELAREWVNDLRRSNAEFCSRNPDYVSTISEADYQQAEREIERVLRKYKNLRQRMVG